MSTCGRRFRRSFLNRQVFRGNRRRALIAIRIVLRGNATIELSATTTTTGNEKVSKSERAKHFLPG